MSKGRSQDRGEESRLLELIGDTFGLLEMDELRRGLLQALHRVLPSAYVSLNEVGPTPDTMVSIIEPHQPAAQFGLWATLGHENPILQHYLRTGDGSAVRFSDVISKEELHGLELYRRLYAPMGVEHQLAFTLPGGAERILAIALSRRERNYSDQECEFVNRARPFLIQAYNNAIEFDSLRSGASEQRVERILEGLRSVGLTRREAEVVKMVALGGSNQHIASVLGISYRTVGKHLEHGFRKLGVGDRSTAARRAWELAEVAVPPRSRAMRESA
ncbi:MAG: helix-turn-helix transcriptional regulator [Solirubrobacteraceae bacterium]